MNPTAPKNAIPSQIDSINLAFLWQSNGAGQHYLIFGFRGHWSGARAVRLNPAHLPVLTISSTLRKSSSVSTPTVLNGVSST
jgi:hypothetical protein